MSTAAPHKTAIHRWSFCRPVALALNHGLLSTKTTFVDHGFGPGGDLKRLHQMGVSIFGWDPARFLDKERTPLDPYPNWDASRMDASPFASRFPLPRTPLNRDFRPPRTG